MRRSDMRQTRSGSGNGMTHADGEVSEAERTAAFGGAVQPGGVALHGVMLGGRTLLLPQTGRIPFFLPFLIFVSLIFSRMLIPCESVGESGDGLPWVIGVVLVLLGTLWRRFQLAERVRRDPQAVILPPDGLTGWLDTLERGLIRNEIRRMMFAVMPGRTEWLIRIFFGMSIVMILVNYSHGSPRTAVNLILEIAGLWVIFTGFRYLMTILVLRQIFLAWMLSLVVGLSAIGMYQYFYEFPQMRAEYAADPDGALRRAGIWFEEGTPARKLFVDRIGSVQPTGPAALPGSFAGVLVPWITAGLVLMGVAVVMSRRIWRVQAVPTVMAAKIFKLLASEMAVLSLILILFCLLLTKSRSAYVGLVAGIGLALVAAGVTRAARKTAESPVVDEAAGRLVRWRRIVGMMCGVGVVWALISLGIAVGGLDREVLSEARKSLGYRLEYWKSTAAMIADHPLTGVGPGNFQAVYTRYKLPESSEEVVDPHNFVMEIAASYGLPTLAIFLAILGILGWRTCRAIVKLRQWDGNEQETEDVIGGEVDGVKAARLEAGTDAVQIGRFYAGGLLSAVSVAVMTWGLTQLLGAAAETPPSEVYTKILLVATVVVFPFWMPICLRWASGPRVRLILPAAAITALLVNLLTVGGIGMPAIAAIFWICVTILLVELRGVEADPQMLPTPARMRYWRGNTLLATVVLFGLLVAAVYGGVLPVMKCRTLVRTAADPLIRRDDDRMAIYMQAASADPFSEQPWFAVATTAYQRMMRKPLAAWSAPITMGMADAMGGAGAMIRESAMGGAERLWEDSQREIFRRVPNTSRYYRTAAGQAMELAQTADEKGGTEQAGRLRRMGIEWYAESVRLYPTSAVLRAEYAMALKKIGTSEATTESRRQRDEAIRLDAITPHEDKKLPVGLRARLEVGE